MNYTKTDNTVIFELDLSSYFGKSNSRLHGEKWINSIQEFEEYVSDNFESNYSYIDNCLIDDKREEVKNYLISTGYTSKELDLFSDELNSDIRRALSDAWDNSHQYEYIKEYLKQTQEKIELDLKKNLSIKYNLIDDLTDKNFRANFNEKEFLKLEIKKRDIKNWLKENYKSEKYQLEKDYIDYFHDYALDYDMNPINSEYVDYYCQLGDYNDYLECFKAYNDIENIIINYRASELKKINNLELASLELKPTIEKLENYINQYIIKEPQKSKITRQIKALKSVIKNAV